ncbi:branched-chain amino acid ABC transporter permease [Brevibacterium sp. 91QC2O2]|jgi:branched-chain amino acid transport system permease protein|uniref:branched-chain amino acid ABC transporter permease n=1 Tax=Brevibacterium sp. 91QC2O2 TaxID=2968458 RepID=UPI00211BEE44|nr:branched-chain amino acid ABC transporter permease [Brevibacterium sp. 91QC2O2]MCQ9368978.1 branched-chain amino acid ABC transporter permease [Brevibacterium sp. 91QC2O2]
MNALKLALHNPRVWGTWAILIALALVPVVFGNENYVMRLFTGALCTAIAVYGMNILLGFTGLLSLAQGGFFGVGAYTVGLLTTDYDWPFWTALITGVLFAAVLGYLCGLIALRTKDEYFAIFTMAIGFIIYLIVSRWESVTHAHTGVNNVKLPEGGGVIDFTDPIPLFYLVFAILALIVYVTWAIRRSSVGRTLISIRTSEDLADAIGVNVGVNKQLAFAASTALAGLGGGLYASVIGFIGPDSAMVDKTFEMLMFILVGGLGTVAGPLLGTLIVTFIFELFQDFQAYRFILVGPIIIALVIFAPRGIVGYLGGWLDKRKARKRQAEAAARRAAAATDDSTRSTATQEVQ